MADKKEKKKFMKDFKAFISKGNMLDMAVGVIVGGAFGKIITSLVNDVIMPPISLLLGNTNIGDLKLILKEAVIEGDEVINDAITLNYGNFIQLIIDFLLVSFCVFLVIRTAAKMREKVNAREIAAQKEKQAQEEAKKAAEAA
ncbi:MAG TPA: large conductance mechanosensitive channel protein MscL, partial [Bacillota bacterium]|nr:large conductance mechanosensitive channel protein MscL [Bacillota bacterium]